MAKQVKNENNIYVPMELVSNSLVKKNPIMKRMKGFIQKHNIMGPLTWEKLEDLDKVLANDFRKYAEENRQRIDLKYSKFGANLQYAGIERAKKQAVKSAAIALKVIAPSTKTTKSPSKKIQVKSKVERVREAKDLLKVSIDTLNTIQLKAIFTYANLDYKSAEPYYNKLQELQNKKSNYNKPKPIQAAKALITFNFSGKSNPMKWTESEFDPIIKAKLYCAKMGIEYLKAKEPQELKTAMNKAKENLDKVLKALNYKDINEVKF